MITKPTKPTNNSKNLQKNRTYGYTGPVYDNKTGTGLSSKGSPSYKSPSSDDIFSSFINPLSALPKVSGGKNTSPYTDYSKKSEVYKQKEQPHKNISSYVNNQGAPAPETIKFSSPFSPAPSDNWDDMLKNLPSSLNNQGAPAPETIKFSSPFSPAPSNEWNDTIKSMPTSFNNQGLYTVPDRKFTPEMTFREKYRKALKSNIKTGMSRATLNQGYTTAYMPPSLTTAAIDGIVDGSDKLHRDIKNLYHSIDILGQSGYDMKKQTDILQYYPNIANQMQTIIKDHNAKHGTDGTYKIKKQKDIYSNMDAYTGRSEKREAKYTDMPVADTVYDIAGIASYNLPYIALSGKSTKFLAKSADIALNYYDRIGKAVYDGEDYENALKYASVGAAKDVGAEHFANFAGNFIISMSQKILKGAENILEKPFRELCGGLPTFKKGVLNDDVIMYYAKETVKDVMKKPEMKLIIEKLKKICGDAVETTFTDYLENIVIKITYNEYSPDMQLKDFIHDALKEAIVMSFVNEDK